MTCLAGGRADCEYPNHACAGDANCQWIKNRTDPRYATGLNCDAFRYFPYVMVIAFLVMVYALHRFGIL